MSKYGDIDGQGIITPLPADFAIAGQVQGDVIYFNGTNWVRLAPGTSGQVLKTQGAAANPVYGLAQDLQIASQSIGSMLYFNGTNWIRLAPGTAGQLLQANGAAAPTWVAAPSGAQGSAICSFRASGGSGQYNINGGNVTGYTENFDTGGNFVPSTGVFTAPQNGIYLFQASINFNPTGTSTTGYIHMLIGGIVIDGLGGGGITASSTGYCGGGIVLSLSTGNTVVVGSTYGSTPYIMSGGSFSGTLLA